MGEFGFLMGILAGSPHCFPPSLPPTFRPPPPLSLTQWETRSLISFTLVENPRGGAIIIQIYIYTCLSIIMLKKEKKKEIQW